jgi:nitrogen fixation/metabolism regulation signal transduction histidine kinase
MSEEPVKILAQAGEILAKAESAIEGPIRTIADLLLEHSQLFQVMTDELLADRQEQRVNNRRLDDAARKIENAALEVSGAVVEIKAKLDAVSKTIDNAARNSYDAFTTAEALEQPLQAATTAAVAAGLAAARGAKAAEDGAKQVQAVSRRVKNMTGRFSTFKAETLAKAEKEGKSPRAKFENYFIFLKAFNNLPLSTRILATIMVSLGIIAFIIHMFEAKG